jgi:hypothetical protein
MELTKSLGSLGADMEISIFGTTGSAPKAIETKNSVNANALNITILRF